jgi:hypothetical protein
MRADPVTVLANSAQCGDRPVFCGNVDSDILCDDPTKTEVCSVTLAMFGKET